MSPFCTQSSRAASPFGYSRKPLTQNQYLTSRGISCHCSSLSAGVSQECWGPYRFTLWMWVSDDIWHCSSQTWRRKIGDRRTNSRRLLLPLSGTGTYELCSTLTSVFFASCGYPERSPLRFCLQSGRFSFHFLGALPLSVTCVQVSLHKYLKCQAGLPDNHDRII